MEGNVWVCTRESASAAGRVPTRAERTKESQATTYAERAKSVASQLEIGSSGAVYSHDEHSEE